MTNEYSDLLKDLCARLPYGVICKGICNDLDVNKDEYVDKEVTGILTDLHHYKCSYGNVGLMNQCSIESIKPYLRPMSSMTEEEKKEFISYAEYEEEESVNGRHYEYYLKDFAGTPEAPKCNFNAIDWLLAHHFDYRGLIEKDLALPAPKGMYNFK